MPYQEQCSAGIRRPPARRLLVADGRVPNDTIAFPTRQVVTGPRWAPPHRKAADPRDGSAQTAPLTLTTAIRQWARLAAVMVGVWVGGAEAGNPYLRLGVGFDLSNPTAFMDVDCRSASPAALYGCGRDSTGAPRRSLGDFGTPTVLEFGLGRESGSMMRYELLFEYRPRFEFDGNANFVESLPEEPVRARLSSLSAMVAGFVNLDRSKPANSPFVGFGVGMARNRVGTTTMTFRTTRTIVPGNSSSDLAWMVTAGFGVELDERTTLEVAWRYTDLGRVRTGTGSGRVVRLSDGTTVAPLNLAPTQARITSNGLRISVRRPF